MGHGAFVAVGVAGAAEGDDHALVVHHSNHPAQAEAIMGDSVTGGEYFTGGRPGFRGGEGATGQHAAYRCGSGAHTSVWAPEGPCAPLLGIRIDNHASPRPELDHPRGPESHDGDILRP